MLAGERAAAFDSGRMIRALRRTRRGRGESPSKPSGASPSSEPPYLCLPPSPPLSSLARSLSLSGSPLAVTATPPSNSVTQRAPPLPLFSPLLFLLLSLSLSHAPFFIVGAALLTPASLPVSPSRLRAVAFLVSLFFFFCRCPRPVLSSLFLTLLAIPVARRAAFFFERCAHAFVSISNGTRDFCV